MKPIVARDELKLAMNEAKKAGVYTLPNGWAVKVEKSFPLPARPGPAWYYVFYLVSPTGKSFGGRTSMATMVSHFCNPHAWQWVDDYKGNGYTPF